MGHILEVPLIPRRPQHPAPNFAFVTFLTASPPFFSSESIPGPAVSVFLLPTHGNFCDWALLPLSSDHSDASKSGSFRHPYGDAESSRATFNVRATVEFSPIPGIAAPCPTKERPHLSFTTTSLVFTDTASRHTVGQLSPYLAVTRSIDIRWTWNAMAWDKWRRLDI